MGSDELKLLDGLQTVPVLNTKNQSGSVQITALTFRLCQYQSYAIPPELQTLSQKLFTIIQVFSILQYLQVPEVPEEQSIPLLTDAHLPGRKYQVGKKR